MDKEKIIQKSVKIFTPIGLFMVFYGGIIAISVAIITYLNLWDSNKIKEHSDTIFFFGVGVFIISKFVDLHITAKKSNSLYWLFSQALFDALTPALFVFSMFGMDKYYYFVIEGVSCFLLAVIYSKKILSLERKSGLSEMELVMQDKARAEKLLEKIDSNYTAKLTPPKGIDAQVKWIVVTTIIAGLIICLAKLLF
ncbi:hypothetical protein [Proteus terrae]|uniref:hypothetical protein n=1 Tax=Proteus terrae TaxID=1574161 RepID=UPI0035268A11